MGTRDERVDDLFFEDIAGDPSEEGQVRRTSGDLRVYLGGQVKSLIPVDSPASHLSIDQLVHDLAENAYEEVTRTAGQVTSVIVWTSPAKTMKIRETVITRAGGQVSVVVVKQYDVAGALAVTLTKTYTRTSGQITSGAWVVT